jgi:SAM-dependent methyltransferase
MTKAGMHDRDTNLRDQTIRDFGRQWTTYTDNHGYYGSLELLRDLVEPLLKLAELQGQTVVEIGSGSGRIVNMLLAAGVRRVYALEPSSAFETLKQNISIGAERVEFLNIRGDEVPAGLGADLLVSLGVIHHIPKPEPVITASYNALRPGGRILLWLYGHEGNELYLATVGRLRRITRKLPHALLAPICYSLFLLTELYTALCSFLPLPMRDYVVNVFSRFERQKRYLVIYDQLNPHYAKYYRKAEAISLLSEAGFHNIQAYRRHGYSWTIIGTRPDK